MTWLYSWEFGGGETRDSLLELTGWTVITSPVKNGTGALLAPAGVGATATLLVHLLSTQISCMEAWVNYDGNPAAADYIMRFYEANQYTGYFLEVGTDRRVRIVYYSIPTYTPLTPWSEAVLGNGAYTHLVCFLDPLTLGTNHVWMTVVIDDVTQFCVDLGTWNAYFDAYGRGYTGALSTVNVDVRFDDICGLTTTSAADAPHLAAAPIVKVYAQHPNAEGANLNWGRVPNSGTWWSKWSDATGNDGDTTALEYASVLGAQDSDFESSADLGWGAGAVVLQNYEPVAGLTTGPVWSIVHRVVPGTGTKWQASNGPLCSLGSSTVGIPDPGSSYIGTLIPLKRNSGSWAPADLGTLTAGAKTAASDMDKQWRITTLMLQWAYYDTTLSLTPAPMIPQGMMF